MLFKNFLLAVVMASLVSGQTTPNPEKTTQVAILKQINKVNDDGSYTFGYEAADGTFKAETRDVDGNVKGKYGYLDESGQLKTIEYVAGKTDGFSAKGQHLPEPAPAPAPAPQQFNNQQQFNPPPQQFNNHQQFAPQQQFNSPPQQFNNHQQFAPQQQFNNPPAVPQLPKLQVPPPQVFNQRPINNAPQQFAPQQSFPQQNFGSLPQQQGLNSFDQGNNQRKAFSFSFNAPATFPQPQQQQPFNNNFAPPARALNNNFGGQPFNNNFGGQPFNNNFGGQQFKQNSQFPSSTFRN